MSNCTIPFKIKDEDLFRSLRAERLFQAGASSMTDSLVTMIETSPLSLVYLGAVLAVYLCSVGALKVWATR